MHAPAASLLLLTSLASAIHHGDRHGHIHKRAPDVVTEVAYVTQMSYVTVDANGNALPSSAPAADNDAPVVQAPAPEASAPAPQPVVIPQKLAPTQVAAPKEYAAPAAAPAVNPKEQVAPALAPAAAPKLAPAPKEAPAPAVQAADAKAPASAPKSSNGKFPFSQIIAYGDSMTDNGNGTYAHCTQSTPGDCDNKIYGHKTWTDGPVAVSYLSDKLGVPLTQDYAWGWNHGGGPGDKMAATIKQSFTASPDSQSGFQQVASYLASDYKGTIGDTLQFLWIGSMDITFPKFSYPDNTQWSNEMAGMISDLVGQLIDAGAPYVFVPGLYAKQISPSHTFIASLPLQQQQLGEAIQQANTAIKSTIEAKYGEKVIYYDVFDRMVDIWNNHASYGIDMVGDNFCDGDTKHPSNFDVCLMQGQGDRWYWINFTDFTSHVHSLIADDMYSVLQKRFS